MPKLKKLGHLSHNEDDEDHFVLPVEHDREEIVANIQTLRMMVTVLMIMLLILVIWVSCTSVLLGYVISEVSELKEQNEFPSK